jgi:hypothetical protein
MVPYTVEQNKVTGWYEVGPRYHGWHPEASFVSRESAELWAKVKNGSAKVIGNCTVPYFRDDPINDAIDCEQEQEQ